MFHGISRFFKFSLLLFIPNLFNFEVLGVTTNGTLVVEVSLLFFTQFCLQFVPNVVLNRVQRDFNGILFGRLVHD